MGKGLAQDRGNSGGGKGAESSRVGDACRTGRDLSLREGSQVLTLEETGFQGKIRALGSGWEVRQEEKQEAEGLAAGPSKGTSGRGAQTAAHEGCRRA